MSQKLREESLEEKGAFDCAGWRRMGKEGCLVDLVTWWPFRLWPERLVRTVAMEELVRGAAGRWDPGKEFC